jgi:uncharacterized integral membrane protein
MRFLSSLLGATIVAVAAVLLTLFAIENSKNVTLNFLGMPFTGNVWWLILGAAAIGLILGLLLVAPGRLIVGYRSTTLSRVNTQREHELAALRDEHEQLQAERDQLYGEHERVQSELAHARDEAAGMRDEHTRLQHEHDQALAERDQAVEAREGMGSERERLHADHVQALSERDQLRDENAQLRAERDDLHERLAAAAPIAPVAAAAAAAPTQPEVSPGTSPQNAAEDHVVPAPPTATAMERPMAPPPPEPAPEPTPEAAVASAEPPGGEAPETQEPLEEREDRVLTHAPQTTPAQTPTDAAAPALGKDAVSEDTASEDTVVDHEPAHPSLGERVRAVFTGRPADEVRAEDASEASPAEPDTTDANDTNDATMEHNPAGDEAPPDETDHGMGPVAPAVANVPPAQGAQP